MVARKKRKVRYKKYVFKLSFKQKELIDKFCQIHKTTPNKLIRRSVKEFLARNVTPEDEYYISENQLSIFDEIEDEYNDDSEENEDTTFQDSPRTLFD